MLDIQTNILNDDLYKYKDFKNDINFESIYQYFFKQLQLC